MAKTTLRQIEDRLRGMFTPGEQRKLVFWYDESASFENEVNQLNLPGVTVYRMEPRTQFATKWMLEIDHPDESFLIYAPFAIPRWKKTILRICCATRRNTPPTRQP